MCKEGKDLVETNSRSCPVTDVGVEFFGAETSGVIVNILHVIFEKVKFNCALCCYNFQMKHPRCVPNN